MLVTLWSANGSDRILQGSIMVFQWYFMNTSVSDGASLQLILVTLKNIDHSKSAQGFKHHLAMVHYSCVP